MAKANALTITNNSFSYNSLAKKKDSGISVPFLPKGYEKNVEKYIKSGLKSKYRNEVFERVLRFKQADLKKYCKRILAGFGYKVKSTKGYLYAEGEIPVMLIAHMDTVHKDIPNQIIYKDNFITSPQGIGGDDRCGVYSVLEIVKELKCHVLFAEDEEIGCVGSKLFAGSDLAEKLRGKIKYCIELDRRGTNDAVFYECDNSDFVKFIESTGYFKENWGTLSDICYVAPALDCSAVNLSIGYQSEHTKSEYIDLKVMKKNIAETKKIIQKECERFEWIEMSYIGRYGLRGDFFSEEDYWDYIAYNSSYGNQNTMQEWEIYWENYQMFEIYHAYSMEEALGMFMQDYPNVCYNDINYIDTAYYREGEIRK